MRLDPCLVGTESEVSEHRYGWRELALYALSVGASLPEDLDLLYENRGPLALPSYAVVPAFAAVKRLQQQLGGDPTGLIHVGQRIVIHRALASHGCLKTRGRVHGLYDLGKLAQSTLTSRTEDEDGRLIAETEWVVFHTRDLVPNGEQPPPRATVRAPARACDVTVRYPISLNQAALYRLNGDDNPLHIDPAVAREAGFQRPILHGLCTLGMACLTLHRAGLPLSGLRRLEGQFRDPVFPGDVLVVELWQQAQQVFLRAYAEDRPNKAALGHGYAEFEPKESGP